MKRRFKNKKNLALPKILIDSPTDSLPDPLPGSSPDPPSEASSVLSSGASSGLSAGTSSGSSAGTSAGTSASTSASTSAGTSSGTKSEPFTSMSQVGIIANMLPRPNLVPRKSLPIIFVSTPPTKNEQLDLYGDSKDMIEISKMFEDMDISNAEKKRLKMFIDQRDAIEDIRGEDLERLGELGSGNGGVVTKVRHIPSDLIMARKIIHLELKPDIKKQILRELSILNKCIFPHIVGFYKAFQTDGSISICMEYMDAGSLDVILKHCRRIPEDILAKVTLAVLKGLLYLREKHDIMHRDIKPSNILINSSGEIKLCDFGVSGQLVDSMANTFVGTRSYMSPERLEGDEYSVQSDIWSLGISLIEMALGIYPIPRPTREEIDHIMNLRENESFPPPKVMAIFDLLECIVNEPAPRLVHPSFTANFTDFIDKCLEKNPRKRATLKTLMEHPWIKEAEEANTDIVSWVCRTVNLSPPTPK